MTAQEYIFKELNALLIKFPSIVFKYKLDKNDNTHIISVEPIEEYEGNNEYMEAESDLVFDFENKYLPETIMFVSTNSLIVVNEPDKVFCTPFIAYYLTDKVSYSPEKVLFTFTVEINQEPKPILNYNFHFNWDKFETVNTEHDSALAA